jgi:3'(2'), 5'-bisphosphate nucleotidase
MSDAPALSLSRELEAALGIARKASELIMGVYATAFTVELKGPNDPVTRADREANALICEALAAAFPGDAILAEESVPEAVEEIAAAVAHERVWFVDPIDGTREFADRNGEFAVMIGLAIHGRARLGVVLMPATGQAIAGYTGGDGERVAFREDASGNRGPLSVSEVRDPREATLMISRSHRPKIIDPVVAQLGITKMIPCGSVGVKVARVALGSADLYVHGGHGAKRWDSCAPEAILEAAGGRFTDIEGEPIDYRSSDLALDNGLVASNGALHDVVLAVTSIYCG